MLKTNIKKVVGVTRFLKYVQHPELIHEAYLAIFDDKGVFNLGNRNGLSVIRTADLPLPPVDPQGALGLTVQIDSDDPKIDKDEQSI